MARFGDLAVTERDGVRALVCGVACHGSAWIEPAAVIDGRRYAPGPVPESVYQLGWLLAADAADQRALMAGLGCGSGPIALAWAFPRLVIDVVEIDPEVIALARAHFPLLAIYEAQGRIRIHRDEIVGFAWRMRDRYDVAFLDCYTDLSRLVCPDELLHLLHGQAGRLWLNVLEEYDFRITGRCAAALTAAGWTPACTLAAHDHGGNVLIGTAVPDRDAWNLRPFATLDHANAAWAHQRLDELAASWQPWPR